MKKENPQAAKVIDALGGTTAVARLLEIKPPSVSEWREKGLPKARLKYFQLLRPDLFQGKSAKRRAIRP